MKKKVLICAGGTGGHVYPAMALGQHLIQEHPEIDLLFAGGHLDGNRYFDRESFPYKNIACGNFTIKNPLKLAANAGYIFKGFLESRHLIQHFKPDVMVGFGSYHTFPAMLAAAWMQIPLILHASDSVPGKVIRLFSKGAIATGIQFPETAKWLRGKSIEVCMPLRPGFKLDLVSTAQARHYFHLDETLPAVLIFGGSQGAAGINNLISKDFVEHLKTVPILFQILHITGSASAAEKARDIYQRTGIRACVKDFEPRMEMAWQAANLVISRAGAATIAEQLEFEVPGIYIPYPHAAENHQEKNALFVVNHVRGAEMFLEHKLVPISLAKAVESFFAEESSKLKQMRKAFKTYKEQLKPIDLYKLVIQTIDQNKILPRGRR